MKVRYQDPLPAPLFSPKLLNTPDREGNTRPKFLNAVINEIQLPMIVDAQCGMREVGGLCRHIARVIKTSGFLQ
jgi:RNA polymerase II-associated factor 1